MNSVHPSNSDSSILEGTRTIGFADELAILVRKLRAELGLGQIRDCMEDNKLELAPEKTEVVIFKGSWKKSREASVYV